MPTYEYLCQSCGRFEEFQAITAPALETCPKCGGAVTRLISAGGGMIFKGSGFYVTDYRKPDYQKRAKEDSKSPESSQPKSTTGGKEGGGLPPPAPKDKGGTGSTEGGSS